MIIKDEQELRKLLPNIQMTVDGEVNIFDKMTPFIDVAWTTIRVTFGLVQIDYPEQLVRKIVAFCAMYNAAPSLDCVLTPNGFAVVYNNSMMPTAKLGSENPMEKMRESLKEQIFRMKLLLIEELNKNEDWRRSYSGVTYTGLVFSPVELADEFDASDFRQYFTAKKRVERAQMVLAEYYLSSELLDRIIISVAKKAVPTELGLILRLSKEFCRTPKDEKEVLRQIGENIVNTIATSRELLKIWSKTRTGELFLYKPDFSNDKKSSGYFF